MYCILSCMLSAFCYQFILMLHCRQLKYKHICSPSKINIIYLFLSLHLCRFFSFSLSLSYFFHNRTFSGCSSLPNPDSQSWLGLCEWKSLEVSTVPHQSGREGTHSVSIPTAVTGAETNRWLVGDYWGEQVRKRGGEEKWVFRRDVKFSIVELNEKWDAPTLQRQTNTTQLEHTGGICWCGIVRKCNIIQLSINFYSGERGKYVSYNLFFRHAIFTGQPRWL